MAGAAVIGALRVVLGADTTAFEDGLKGASSKLSSFGATMAKGAAAIGVAVAAAGVGIGVAIKGALNQADQLGKMAQSVGIGVEELSKLKHAADLSDVSLEALGKSVGILSKNMSAVAGGAVGPAASAFRALGVSVKNSDGTLKSSSLVMEEVAARFARMEDGAGKTALAMAIFGKSGAALIPMLNGGAAGLRDAAKEAEELGIVIDKKTAVAAENFNDNLTRLGKIQDGITLQMAARLAPTLSNLSNVFLDAAKSSKGMDLAASALDIVLKSLASSAVLTGAVFAHIGERISAVASAVMLVAKGQFSQAMETMKTGTTSLQDRFATTAESLRKIWSDTGDEVAKKSEDTGKKMAAPIIMAGKGIQESILELQLKTRVLRGDFDALAEGFPEAANKLKLFAMTMGESRVTVAALSPELQKLNTAMLQFRGAQMTEESLLPWQKYEQELMRVNQVFAAGGMSLQAYQQKTQQVAEAAGATWQQAGASIAGSFATIAGAFGKESKGMATAAKVFGVIQATISMFTGAAKALELPFPANLAAMTAVLAQGASLVASIKSQSIPKFAHGGSIRVGGSGRTDSVMMQAMVSPGEEIDIKRPGDRGFGARGGGDGRRPQEIVLQGDNFSRSSVERLIDVINDVVGDGHRSLVVARR